jgi:hypothetical protein
MAASFHEGTTTERKVIAARVYAHVDRGMAG